MKRPVEITAAWLRKEGQGSDTCIILLLEISGKWVEVIREGIPPMECEVNHVVYANGIRSAAGVE